MSAGTTVGKYELLKCLARGATTDLWLARTRGIAGFERHVVIKRCHEQQAQDPGFVQAFMTEARLAGALHHNNIIQVQDIGDDGGIPYFAMEYIHGADMRTVLAALTKQKQRLPLEHVIAIVSTTAQALHHAHNASTPDGKPLAIVHRDVTPANILVSFDGNVKVGDFGIAKAAITLTTQVGVLKGRSPYMAPEQCKGHPVDCRSDVFALGIVLWEMLTMRRLYKGKTDHEVMQTIVTSTPPKPSSVYTYIPKQLEVITLKALAKEPINRYQSAAELATALETVARALGRTSTTSTLGAFVAKLLGERPEPWLIVSDRVEKRASVDFDSDEPSGDEFEADTQKDILPAPLPKPPLPPPKVGKPIVPADSVVVAAELENVVERGDTENDAVGTTQTAMPPPPPAQRKRSGKKSEPTQIVTPLDVNSVAERPRKRTLLVGASGCVVAILIAIVAGRLVASKDTNAAVLDTAKPVERTPVATGPTQPADPAPAPAPTATNPPAPADPEPSPAPAIDPSTAANGGYASHPGTSIPEPPREGPGLGDFATGSGNVPKPEPVAEPVKAEPVKVEPPPVEAPPPTPPPVEARRPAPPVEAPAPKPVAKKLVVVKKPAPAKKPPAAPKAKYDPDSLFLKVPK